MATVYLGIGSNLGNRDENIKSAIALLQDHNISVVQCSTIIETAPVGGPINQRNYLNGALKVETKHSPNDLLTQLKAIEQKLGRVKTVRNDSRTIDLDILFYDQLNIQTPQLMIPHPRMFDRDFVMIPLKEIAPQLIEDFTHARH